MNKEDKQEIRGFVFEMIEKSIKRASETGWVEFDCPNCGHKTIAKKEGEGVVMGPDYRGDYCFKKPTNRRCLVCGKLFRLQKEETYIEVTDG